MESFSTVQNKGTTTIQQSTTQHTQNEVNRYLVYPYQVGTTLEVTLESNKAFAKLTEKPGYEGYVSASSYAKRTLEAVLIQRKAASMECDPPLITSVPGYLAYVPPPPPDCSIKDELVQRQEEFIIECMYPKRILPNNVKLRDDNRPLSPSRIPGIKLTMREIYGPERSPTSKRGCGFIKRRSPSPIRWRRLRSESRDRFRSRSRSRSMARSPKIRMRSPSPRIRSLSPRLRLISPRLRSMSPRLRMTSPRLRTPSPRLKKLTPRKRTPIRIRSPRLRSPSPRIRSFSPRRSPCSRVRLFSPRLWSPSPRLRSPISRLRTLSPRLRSPSLRMRSLTPCLKSSSPRKRSPKTRLRSTSPRIRSSSPLPRLMSPCIKSISPRPRLQSASLSPSPALCRSPSLQIKSPSPRLAVCSISSEKSDSSHDSEDDQLSSVEDSPNSTKVIKIKCQRTKSRSPSK